jgi:hydrogenase nickel incorporation protein HypA/HybF
MRRKLELHMHELSIVESVVESVTASLAAYPGARVERVRLHVGALSSVVVESLEFCWGIATESTALAGARLDVQTLPVTIYCGHCKETAELAGVQSFRCPRCGQPSSEIRQGRELEIDSIEIEDEPAPTTNLVQDQGKE